MNAQSPTSSSLTLACAAALGVAAGAWSSAANAQAYIIPGATPAGAPVPAASSPGGPGADVPPRASTGGSPFNSPAVRAQTPEPLPMNPPAGAATASTPVAPPQPAFVQPVAPPVMPPRPAPVVAAPRAPLPPSPPAQPVKGLPADAPKLVISGGVYSANPEQRRVIVNGQVAKEGADLGSGVVLQQITPEGVVLAFRGSNYKVTY